MDSNQKLLIKFFEENYPELEKAARALWGDHEPTGTYVGTITCPKDGVLVKERFVEKESWEKDTDQAKFCKVCGSPLKNELSDEIIYEFRWREKLIEIIIANKDEFKQKIDELKGIKPQENKIEEIKE